MRLRRIALGLLLTACGGAPDVVRPEPIDAPRSAYHEVPYPPPAALVEVIPRQPQSDAVWVDGSWVWRVRQWAWERGGWLRPPVGARYSRWNAVYAMDGTLLYAPSAWWTSSGARIPDPALLAPANPPPEELTGEHTTPP